MKKIFLITTIAFLIATTFYANAQSNFIQAIKNCENYSKSGSITRNGETFNLLITLEKTKNNKCIYKEGIYQNKNSQVLTCHFNQTQQDFIAKSMYNFTEKYKQEIAKNDIFEAKLTTNVEVLQNYLANPEICTITQSK